MVIVDSNATQGQKTAKELKALGEVLFIKADVSKEPQVINAIKKTIQQFKKLDVLVNNAGIKIDKPVEKLSLEQWNKVIGINLTAAFLFTKYSVKHLRKTKGAIINISSTRALMSEENTESYSATKGGIVALTHALSISLGPDIRVNCISPGWIEVKENAHHTKADIEQHPAGKVGVPSDIANMVMYLAGDNASFITGANFVIDGGMTRKMIYK